MISAWWLLLVIPASMAVGAKLMHAYYKLRDLFDALERNKWNIL